MKTIKERALEIAEEMGIIWREGCDFESGIVEVEAIDFAEKFLAAWLDQQSQEAVAWISKESVYRLRHNGGNSKGTVPVHLKSSSVSKTPLYLAPPPAVPEDYFADACRLAMELECLLLACTDTAAYSKWWESANEALDQHRERIEQMRKEQE